MKYTNNIVSVGIVNINDPFALEPLDYMQQISDDGGGGPRLHIPVMVAESIEWLNLQIGDAVLDLTFGLGGHTRAFLTKIGDAGRVVGLDRDERALEISKGYFTNEPRVRLCKARFSQIMEVAGSEAEFLGARRRAIFMDLGVSSMQLDDASRGFSFQNDGKLDLRMSPDEKTPTAAEIVNSRSEEDLADMIYQFGEERASRRVARAIVEARRRSKITTTLQLAEIVRKAVPFSKADAGRIHPATRTFQALRIVVNREMEELEAALDAALELLTPGGRLAVLSYHSIEDRIVKLKFKEAEEGDYCILTKKPVPPGDAEVNENPRSRSAKLRAIERAAGPVVKTKNKYSKFKKNASAGAQEEPCEL